MNWKLTILSLFFLSCCGYLSAQSFCNSGRVTPLQCNRTVVGHTASGTDLLDYNDYGRCVQDLDPNLNSFSGKEAVYKIEVESSLLRVIVGNLSADVGVFILKDCASGLQCIAKTSVNGRSGTNIETTILPKGSYYIVIDGEDDTQSTAFSLTAFCTQSQGGNGDNGGNNCTSNPCSNAQQISCGDEFYDTTVGRSSRVNSDCNYQNNCVPSHLSYAAGDRVYKINVPSGRDDLSVELSNFRGNLDLFIFKDCDLDHCIAASRNVYSNKEEIKINNPSGTYYVVVDGTKHGEESSFQLKVNCEDKDDFDCDDVQSIHCNEAYYADNRHGKNALDFDDYSHCTSGLNAHQYPYDGKELVYKIRAEAGKSLEIYTKDLHANLDLFLFSSCYGSWNELGNCVARSTNNGSWDERIYVEHPNDGYYYLVIDGRDRHQVSDFKLYVVCKTLCEPEVKTDCDDLHFSYIDDEDSHELKYKFSVPNHYPKGHWTVKSTSGTQTFREDQSINLKFSRKAVYTVCYVYEDSDGCEIQCCKKAEISDPNDCELIKHEDRGDKIKLSVEHTDYDAKSWQRVGSDDHLNGDDDHVLVNKPANGTCATYEALLERNGVYRYCRKKVCGDDENDLAWLDELIADLGDCCEDDEREKKVQKGKLNGQTIYLAPDCAEADGFLTLYKENGDVICQSGGFAGLVCDDIDHVTNLETIFKCGDAITEGCVQLSEETLSCDEDGVITYRAKIAATSATERSLIVFEIDEESRVRFANCNLTAVATLEAGEEKYIELVLEDCSNEDFPLQAGTPVSISVKIDGAANCEVQTIELGVSECDDCRDEPNEDLFCTEQFDPVCGCDGVTYSNACFAEIAGVNLWFKGECPTDGNNGEGADLSLSVDTDVEGFGAFENVAFTITIQNDGPLATEDVSVSIPLPTTAAFTSSSTLKGNYRVVAEAWEIGTLEAGESASLEFTIFTLSSNTDITVYAEVISSSIADPDSTPDNGNGNSANEDDEASETISPSNNANGGNQSFAKSSMDLDNFPNPFQVATTIQFRLANTDQGTLSIFDVNGKRIFEVNRVFDAGLNQIEFRPESSLPRGVYYYRLQTAELTLTRSMLLGK